MLGLKDVYGDDRKTVITEAEGDVSMEDLILNDDVVTLQNLSKRTTVDEFKIKMRQRALLVAVKKMKILFHY